MGGRTVLYRGILKSCNYHCSYCPFSKHAMSQKELEQDREQWFSFLETYIRQAEAFRLHALMTVPYGEALIHPWYWEGLARVSALDVTEAAGAQTNLGFPVAESLGYFMQSGGKIEKLRLWATFHPEMTSISEFVKNCILCMKKGVRICAGAVGVPENLDLLRQLRKELPEEIYLWINKMDGLGRPYTDREARLFSEIDPYFFRELSEHPADVSKCRQRIFVEENKKLRLCVLSAPFGISTDIPRQDFQFCKKKRCSCYLAYGGRNDLLNHLLFGPYPVFRIPRRPKAVFLDIEGTLYFSSSPFCRSIPAEIRQGLKVLAEKEKTVLFFATTLPYEEAYKRCKSIWPLFSGGVFAGGAHILLEGVKESFYFLDESETYVSCLKPFRQQFRFRMMLYQKGGRCYKITLFRARQKPWSRREAEEVMNGLPVCARERVRYYIEDNCMQIVAARADKAGGVRMLCQWTGISPKEAFAAGDSGEDTEMMELCGFSV